MSRFLVSSKSQCLICFAQFQNERCEDPEYFRTVFHVLCRLLEIDSIEPIRWDFDQHGIPFCESCCSTVAKLKELNDQFELLQQQINNILQTTKQNIIRSASVSNSSSKDVNLTLINRVQYLRHQFALGCSHLLDKIGSEFEDVAPLNIDKFLKIKIESNTDDEVDSSYLNHGSIEEPCMMKVEISENDPLVEAENGSHSPFVCVIQAKYSSGLKNLKKYPDSLSPDKNDCDSRAQSCSMNTSNTITAFVIPEDNSNESDPLDVKPEGSNGFNSDYVFIDESSSQEDVIPVGHSIFLNEDNVFRIQASVSGSDSSRETEAVEFTSCNKGTRSDKQKHKCDICGSKFDTRENFVAHVKIHIGEKPFKCNICEEAFEISSSLLRHSKIHNEEKLRNDTEGSTSLSKEIPSGGKNFKCEYCGRLFAVSRNLVIHKRIHSGEKPYKCEICGRAFSQSHTLKDHTRIHTGEKPFKCELCGKEFGRSSHLNLHRKQHFGEEPHKCEICGKRFLILQKLYDHQRTHSGEKPFKCGTCGRAFSHLVSLVNHARIHTDEKPYKCDICDKSYRSSGTLRFHRKVHSGEHNQKQC